MMATALETREQTEALAKPEATTINLAAMFERLALNPEIPVDKLQALMAMQRSILAEQAEHEFNRAMSAAQAEIRRVRADAYNKQTSSNYATYAALDRALRPIYTTHGFGLSFDTADAGAADMVRVLCYVTHAAGHTRTYRIDMPADGKGAKGGDVMTRTHATGSAAQYGMRYLIKLIFNVAIGDDDDDGNSAGGVVQTPEPEGYAAWGGQIKEAAERGTKVFEAAWKESKPEFRAYLAKTHPKAFAAMRELSKKADAR